MRACLFLVSAAVVITTSACTTTGSSTSSGWDKRLCHPGTGKPISERTLKRIFGAQGIRLYRDHDYCFGGSDPRVLSSFSNAPIGYNKEEAVSASQGDISCNVDRDDIFGRQIERFVWRNDSAPTYVEVLNVDCAIYPNRRADTDALERAMRRLPGVSPQPSTVPSPDAVHD